MRNRTAGIALLLTLLGVPAWGGELRVGAAAVKITPPVGAPMAGYYHAREAEGVHDDLYAKAVVLEQDGTQAALVALDLIGTTRWMVEESRAEIEKTTGLRGDHVMVSATHAHTGPVLRDPGSRRSEKLGGESDLAAQYMATLPTLIAQSVARAEAALEPARVSVATGRAETLAFNRRFHMKDGTVGWNPGKRNPNIVEPAGPIDPAVPVAYFESAGGKPIATYVNYAMHLDTVGGLEFSADYPYTLSRALAEVKGPDMVTVFTIGTAGDINHIDVNWANPQKGHAEAARIGTILAGEVLRAFRQLKPVAAAPLRCRREIVQLPLPALEPGAVEKARAVADRVGNGKSEPPKFLEQVEAFKVLDVAARKGKPQEVEVQVIVLGDELAWVSLPGEVFVELGLALKERSPFPNTIIAELANGAIGYIPTRRAYAQGNYEVVSARCAEGSGELLVDTALKLLNELARPAAARRP